MSRSEKDPIKETVAGLVDELFEMLGSGEAWPVSVFSSVAGSLDTGRLSSWSDAQSRYSRS